MKQKTKETVREKSINWWNSLNKEVQSAYWWSYSRTNYTPSKCAKQLTGREIQKIWLEQTTDLEEIAESVYKPNQKQYSQQEVDRLLDQQAARTTAQILQNKKKEFKIFDESLFKAYISKFSEKDKIKALDILLEETKPNSWK